VQGTNDREWAGNRLNGANEPGNGKTNAAIEHSAGPVHSATPANQPASFGK
jgi:hypothetical protein